MYQIAGLVVIFGHMFSIWLRFKGGKGIATSLGVLLAWSWPLGVMALVTWISIFVLFRYSSLAALVATALAPLYAYFLHGQEYVLSCILLAIFIIVSHKKNIQQLISGSEVKIGGKDSTDGPGAI